MIRTRTSLLAFATALFGVAILQTPSSASPTSDGLKLVHPVHGHKPSSNFDLVYGPGHGLSSAWTRGDLIFPEAFPLASTLSVEEKYIVAGSESSDWSETVGLCDWAGAIESIVARYYTQFGHVPEQLTPEVIRSISGYENIGDENLREYLNPLTDAWPRLSVASPSPGDAYMRPLAPDEITFFGSKMDLYKDVWLDHRFLNPGTGEYEPASLEGPVFYMRIYGWRDVVFANFMFAWTKR